MGGLGLSWPSEETNETAPGLFVTFGAVTPCMAHFFTVLKRKTRGSSSGSESGALTPKEKRICEPSFKADDEIMIALDMAEDIGSQLQLVLQKLNSLESLVEGVLLRFNNLESSVNGIKGEVATLSAKTDDFEKAVGTMDRSLSFLNSEIEQLKSRMDKDEAEIKSLNNRILYQDVYSRRENLRFFNIAESTDAMKENAKELSYRFIERELEVDNACDIEFQ